MPYSTRSRAAGIRRTVWMAVLFAGHLFVTSAWSADLDAARVAGFACDDAGTQASYVFLSQDVGFTCALVPGSFFETIHVVLSTTGATRVRLAIPDSPMGLIVDESWLFPHTGDRINGLELYLPACAQVQTLTLGTLLVLPGEAVNGCHDWLITHAEIDDCNGETRSPWALPSTVMGDGCGTCDCWQCCTVLPPSPLSPPDGATDVPLDAALSWAGADAGRIEISSDPNCEVSQTFEFVGANSFAPEFLQPETTYFWRVSFDGTGSGCSNIAGARSRVVSFTTGRPLALELRPWEFVKRLYR